MKRTVAAVALVVLLVGGIAAPAFAVDPTPPAQPAAGPGGASYPWSGYVQRTRYFGNVDLNYSTYEPAGWVGGGAAPTTAKIVVFMHGYTYNTTPYYATWLEHLVRKGNTVIFPIYQTQYTNAAFFTSNAIWSTKDAIAYLNSVATVKPDTAAGMSLIGHSYGGPVIANMANQWASQGLPQPKSILFAEPYSQTIDSSLAGIPSTTKVDCVVGNYDQVVGRTGCDALWPKLGGVPTANKKYVWMFSDYFGTPDLVSDHNAPAELSGAASVDALDWYGFWKLGDAVRDCGFLGTSCATAVGGGTAQTSMGSWSNGQAVIPMQATTTIPSCPQAGYPLGC
jgi:pimeloyl-ACP methyl ester carboxylesterase